MKPSKPKKEKKPRGEPRKDNMVKVRALGGLRVPFIGRATEGEVTEEQFSRLSRIKIDGKNYVERR